LGFTLLALLLDFVAIAPRLQTIVEGFRARPPLRPD
jgi:hypothetical protein